VFTTNLFDITVSCARNMKMSKHVAVWIM
jgi:hypothetical protein